MAAVPEGANPGRIGHAARQIPGRDRQGHAEPGIDPTNQRGQTPPEIFGFAQSYSTGARGTRGSVTDASTDETMYDGQLEESVTGLSGPAVTSTGAPGSQGARNSAGGESVTYTDFYGLMGGVYRDVTVTGHVSGEGDWTQANDMGYSGGPTLPILQNARPTSSGAGEGRVSTHRSGRGTATGL